MATETVPFTREGFEKLKLELEQLKSVERPKIIREIADAQFWQILAHVLGGNYLTLISEAVAAAEQRLSSSVIVVVFHQLRQVCDADNFTAI